MWALARARGIPPGEITDFSADLNPWAQEWVPPVVIEEAWRKARYYPDPDYHRLRETAADWEGVEPEAILPGNGTADLIHLLSRWRKGARALIPVPTFTEYARAIQADGGKVLSWPLPEADGFEGSAFPRALKDAESEMVFLCNPNNPTGRIWARETVLESLDLCERKGALLVIDEASMELVSDKSRYSLAQKAGRNEHLVVLRSMTKAFGIPGLRIGYAVGHPAVIERLQRMQPPWSVNTLAAEIGTWLLHSAAERLADSRSRLESARMEMERALSRVPVLRLFPSDANFLLCRLQGIGGSGVGAIASALEERGLLIRRCDDFEGLEPDRFLRTAVRRPEENRLLLDALKEVLGHAGCD